MKPSKNERPKNTGAQKKSGQSSCAPLLFLALHSGTGSKQGMSNSIREKLAIAKNELKEKKPPETLRTITTNKSAKNTSRSPSPLSMGASKK